VNADAHAQAQPSRASAPIGTHLRDARALTSATHRDKTRETARRVKEGGEAAAAKDINRQIAAEISWSRTVDRSARTWPARQAFLKRFEREVDPDGTLPPDERHRRAEHAKRAYMLRLAKRAVIARRAR
jgi:hypothetical protein